MILTTIKDVIEISTSIINSLSIAIAGGWILYKFILQQEKYPNINFTVDINTIGKQDNYWIIELIAIIDNKGKAQHKMNEFNFDLNALFLNDKLRIEEKWGNQIDFPNELISGSFLPKHAAFFFVDPGTTAKYSFVTKVPENTSFLILHSTFKYATRRNRSHTAEKTINLQSQINQS